MNSVGFAQLISLSLSLSRLFARSLSNFHMQIRFILMLVAFFFLPSSPQNKRCHTFSLHVRRRSRRKTILLFVFWVITSINQISKQKICFFLLLLLNWVKCSQHRLQAHPTLNNEAKRKANTVYNSRVNCRTWAN